MKADTAEILVDEHVQVRRFCWLRQDEVPRLDELSHKLRSLNGETTGRVQRPVMLAALLLSGLELAESKTPTLDVFTGHGVRYVYPLTLGDVGRVKRLSRSLWPAPKGRPTLENLHAALMRLALQTAESDESFARELAARVRCMPELA
ncbi:MAG: hypothetical protein ACMG6S_30285 [Byssovorax sp.]